MEFLAAGAEVGNLLTARLEGEDDSPVGSETWMRTLFQVAPVPSESPQAGESVTKSSLTVQGLLPSRLGPSYGRFESFLVGFSQSLRVSTCGLQAATLWLFASASAWITW